MDYRDRPSNPRARQQPLPPELDPRGRRANRTQGQASPRRDIKGGFVFWVQILAAALSFVILIGSGYAWASFSRFSSKLQTLNLGTGKGSNIDGADQNILMVGDDSRAGASAKALAALGTEQNAGDNTDTIMVLHVPANGSKATVISFPRDSLVQLPSGGQGKINSVYAAGEGSAGDPGSGARALQQTITKVTGLKIDHFVKVSMFGFYDISVALGGVDVNMCAAQNPSTENDDGMHPGGFSGINVKKGWNHIEGKQALAFVRQRHGLPGGDYDRIVRQEYFLSAVFRKVATPGTLGNPFKVGRLLDAIGGSLVVDEGLRGKGLITFAAQMQNLTAGNLTFSTIPMIGAKDVGAVYQGEQIDAAAMPAFINKVIGKKTAYQAAPIVAPSTVQVSVLNGGQVNGAATTNAVALKTAGFKATSGDGTPTEVTTIMYPAGKESQAKTVAGYVPGAQVTQSKDVTVVTLVLGSDGKAVKGVTATKSPTAAPTVAPHAGATSAPVARTADQTGCIN
jgi:LCP family protein required for cell wall assembly